MSRPAPRKSSTDERRTRELTILNAIAGELNRAVDVDQALERTLALVTEALGLSAGWVWLLDAETNQIYKAAAHNLPPFLQDPVRMAGGWCTCTDEFREGKLTPKNVDVIECSRLHPAVTAGLINLTQGLRFHASIPLYFQDKPLGIMNVTGPSWRKLTRDELRLLSTIGYQVGITIERARLAEQGARLARAEERARIAREIHDTLAQGLTAITLNVESALRTLDEGATPTRQRLERALETARDSLEEARRSVLDLRSPLSGKPLLEALRALARGFTSQTGIRARVSGDGGRALPERVENELFRVAQEALTNVGKHARATEAVIALKQTRSHVTLTIDDNGVGLSPHDGRAAGQGLVGMNERARLVNGTLRIFRKGGGGTRVLLRAPVTSSQR